VGEPLHDDSSLLGALTEELALLVVLVDKVVEDGTALPDGELVALVRDKAGDSAVGVDLEELGALDTLLGVIAKVERLDIVRDAEVLHEHGGLERVGSRTTVRVESVLSWHFVYR